MPQKSEHADQVLFFLWCELYYDLLPPLEDFYANANGGHLSGINQGRKRKAEGVKKGIPDIFLPFPTRHYSGLYIELKKKNDGKVSVDQKRWLTRLRARGYCTRVCRGLEDAQLETIMYLASEYRIQFGRGYGIIKAEEK